MPDKTNPPGAADEGRDAGQTPEIVVGETFGPDMDAGGDVQAPGEDQGAELERARRERDENYDRLLRKTAEFENYRKRVDRERRETAQYAAADLLETLLPIIDDFERALQADPSSDPDAYRT